MNWLDLYSSSCSSLWRIMKSWNWTKYHLSRVVGREVLTRDDLCTLLSEPEAYLNSRTYPTTNELSDLTAWSFPGGVWLGFRSQVKIKESRPETVSSTLSWFIVYKIASDVNGHDLYHLQQIEKEIAQRRMYNLVLIKDDHIAAIKWTMGRIV